jgi:hypothetical protein
VTIAIRPSEGRDAGISGVDLPDGTSKIFFAAGLDSQFEKLPVGQISGASQPDLPCKSMMLRYGLT